VSLSPSTGHNPTTVVEPIWRPVCFQHPYLMIVLSIADPFRQFRSTCHFADFYSRNVLRLLVRQKCLHPVSRSIWWADRSIIFTFVSTLLRFWHIIWMLKMSYNNFVDARYRTQQYNRWQLADGRTQSIVVSIQTWCHIRFECDCRLWIYTGVHCILLSVFNEWLQVSVNGTHLVTFKSRDGQVLPTKVDRLNIVGDVTLQQVQLISLWVYIVHVFTSFQFLCLAIYYVIIMWSLFYSNHAITLNNSIESI
jgi:hypothetical protein